MERGSISHGCFSRPSPWITRFAALVPAGGRVLDLASGGGRHARYFLGRGGRVTCIDRDVSALADLAAAAEVIEADLEDGRPWPLDGRQFEAVVASNYLFRPLMGALVEAVAPGGVLIYETFALGNERFARPRNPDHLLRPGELLSSLPGLQIVAYEAGREDDPPRVIQRICAVKGGEPVPLPWA